MALSDAGAREIAKVLRKHVATTALSRLSTNCSKSAATRISEILSRGSCRRYK